MQNDLTFGRHLRTLRKARGLDQRELAKQVSERLQLDRSNRGFDVSYLSKIENDKAAPSEAAIAILADLLEVDRDDLLALAGKVPPDLGRTLRESRGARMFYRSAQRLDLSDDEWQKLAEQLRQAKEGE